MRNGKAAGTIHNRLSTIRTSRYQSTGKTVAIALLVLVLGIGLGVFAKWLDNLALDSTVWLHRIFETLDLRNFFSDIAVWLLAALMIAVYSCSALRAAINVFCFFAGMCASYHLYTIYFSGFNPASYMMTWYIITLVSPILAALCWYAYGSGIVSILLDIPIFAAFSLSCFSIGLFYISFRGILYLFVFVSSIIILYKNLKQIAISLPAGFLLSFLLSPLWPYK